jgi:Family of unknown function (DUF6978)
MLLSQEDADRLIGLNKRRLDDNVWGFPDLGGSVSVPLISIDGSERFVLDLGRGRINLAKVTYQERYVITPLVRLDVEGPDHLNPDGVIVPCPHLHTYREGFGTRWAAAAPGDVFSDPADIRQTLYQFLGYCNVVDPPTINVGIL